MTLKASQKERLLVIIVSRPSHPSRPAGVGLLLFLLLSVIRFVVAHEILGIPVNAARSPRFARMAHVYCHMFLHAPPMFKDMWGAYFFEAWALTLLLLLQVSSVHTKDWILTIQS